MEGELAEEREEDVVAEDVGVGAFCGECREWAGVGDEEEERGGEDAGDGGLDVTEFDSVEIHDA